MTPYDAARETLTYTGGAVVSYNSHNWTAKWWTQYLEELLARSAR